MNLDHINISTPYDLLVEVKEFYCDVLGLTEGDRPAFSRRGFWLYSEGSAVIHLIESSSHFPSEKQGYLDHVAFNQTGLADFLQSLEHRAVSYKTSYISSLELTQVFLYDPAGVKLEINFHGETISSKSETAS